VSLSALLEDVRAFAQGRVSLSELQQTWLPDLVAPVPVNDRDELSSPAENDRALFWQLVWLFESDAEETRHRERARRVVACMDQTGNAATTLSLLPVIVDQDRFCGVVAKHRTGVVSVTGLRSVIAESRYDSAIKRWLAHASPSAIVAFCEKLQGEHYAAAFELVSRPSA
jgi:hypothetical protein